MSLVLAPLQGKATVDRFTALLIAAALVAVLYVAVSRQSHVLRADGAYGHQQDARHLRRHSAARGGRTAGMVLSIGSSPSARPPCTCRTGCGAGTAAPAAAQRRLRH